VRHSWLWLLCLLVFACSNLKLPQHPQVKETADVQLRYALQMEANRDYQGAEDGFNGALDKYYSFGELKGQLACLSGLARLELAAGTSEENNSALKRMEDLIGSTALELDYYLLLFKVHKLQLEKDYRGISQLAVPEKTMPLEESLQLAIAKIQADSYLHISTPQQAKELLKDSKKLHKQIKQRRTNSLELLSSAWYALGYFYHTQKDYAQADKYLDKAMDWDYRFGNLSGLGHCLWLKAKNAAAQAKIHESKSFYTRAEGIFTSLGETDLLQAIRLEMTVLKGESP